MVAYANIAFPAGICLIGLILYFAYIGLFCKINSPTVLRKCIYKSLFFVYIAWISLYLLVPSNFWLRVYCNMIGWKTAEIDVSEMFTGAFNVVPIFFRYVFGDATYGGWTYRMLLSNVILFVPFGMLFPSVLKKVSYKNVVITCMLFSLIIELLQPVVGRSFDVDDIIMRIIGTTFGFLFYLTVKNRIDVSLTDFSGH